MDIVQPCNQKHLRACRNLFAGYHRSIGVDLSYQGFQQEVENLPGAYSHPDGSLFIAMEGDEPVGCVALRRLNVNSAELKRLYVLPRFRKDGLGRKLCYLVLNEAMENGYESVFLDTLPVMHEAIALYRSLGFTGCAAYYETPLEDTVFMRLDLSRSALI